MTHTHRGAVIYWNTYLSQVKESAQYFGYVYHYALKSRNKEKKIQILEGSRSRWDYYYSTEMVLDSNKTDRTRAPNDRGLSEGKGKETQTPFPKSVTQAVSTWEEDDIDCSPSYAKPFLALGFLGLEDNKRRKESQGKHEEWGCTVVDVHATHKSYSCKAKHRECRFLHENEGWMNSGTVRATPATVLSCDIGERLIHYNLHKPTALHSIPLVHTFKVWLGVRGMSAHQSHQNRQ